jgi:hypothetical protein
MLPRPNAPRTILKYLQETPKGIFIIVIPWLTLSGCVVFQFIDICLLEHPRSCDINPHLTLLPWTWSMFVPLMEYVFVVALLLLTIAGPVVLAVGLLRRKRNAVDAARYLALFWLLLWIVSFALSLEDRATRPPLEDWLLLALVVSYNLWCWWYLSRTGLQDQRGKEWTFLNLKNDRSES